MNLRLYVAAVAIALLLSPPGVAQRPAEHDIVVYGGTSAGVAAAVHAARLGKRVILVAPETHLGGLTSGGLGWTDTGRKEVIGGVSREFYQRLKRHYDKPEAWKHERPEDNRHYVEDDDAIWVFEPHVAEAEFESMLAETDVKVIREAWLDRNGGVEKAEGRIRSFRTLDGTVYAGKIFIDATYEGDLMAAAGVSYTVGRESNAQYNETLNGFQHVPMKNAHLFTERVSPYIVPDDPESGLVARIGPGKAAPVGTGDDRVQAYCYRMCMTNVAEIRVPFPKPEPYDESQYELLFRHFEAGSTPLPMKIDMLVNGKSDTNNKHAFSTDNIGMNYDYPDASYDRRAEILKEHRIYQQGLMWTLANHPRIPQAIRDEMAQWGLAADEFKDHDNWPHQIYVREARRMVGDVVVNENHLRGSTPTADSIGMGSYNMDSHNVQRYVAYDEHGAFVQNEGDVQERPGRAYEISYGAIVPKRAECANLFVPVCVSASHIAFGSIRMEPVFMILGHSAATAAAIAIDSELDVQDVPYEELKERLIAEGQILTVRQTIDLPGLVMDDAEAEKTGLWTTSASNPGYYGAGYAHDNNEAKGEKTVRYRIALPNPGRYQVRMSYTADPNRASNVPVTIHAADNPTVISVNQRRAPESPDRLHDLGVYEFDTDFAVIEVSTNETDGHVIADVIQLLPQKERPQ